MRILCDQNVARKYVSALEAADGLSVATVADVLDHDAPDVDIAVHAEAEDWVLLTSDHDFYLDGGDHGLLVYDQLADPAPGDILAAIRRIAAAYDANDQIVEPIPGEWV